MHPHANRNLEMHNGIQPTKSFRCGTEDVLQKESLQQQLPEGWGGGNPARVRVRGGSGGQWGRETNKTKLDGIYVGKAMINPTVLHT